MTDTMTSRERIAAAVAGEPVDRPPVSLWHHFPERDQTAADLTASTLAWQRRFEFDLVKFMPPGDYPTIDWGATSDYRGAAGGTRTTTRFPINGPGDWAKLTPLDVRQGFNGVVLDAVRRTRDGLSDDVPLLQTIFSPLTIAMKLSNGGAIEHSRAHPEALRAGLEVIAPVTAAMARASIDAGADGLFFASQCADFRLLDETEYREFGVHYDLTVLADLPDSAIVMLHLHGDAPMFDLQALYPAQILNWHDRHAQPDLPTGQRESGRCVAGGINERTIATMAPADAAAQARDAIATMQGRRLIVAPGCVIPVATPAVTVRAIVDAVRE